MGHHLRRDEIPLTKAVGALVLETFETHMRPTDASGKQAPMDRASAEKALREAYHRPSEPDRPRPGGQRQQAPVPAISATESWPDPGEIAHTPGSAPYPIEVFPEVARKAILEYQAYGKQPLPMLADACLAQTKRVPEVIVSSRQRGEQIELEVRDNGVGMDEATLAHCLEPYFTTKSVGDGMGLGLSLCEALVREHGGRIEIDSAPGVGTRVRVRLPIAPETIQEEPT